MTKTVGKIVAPLPSYSCLTQKFWWTHCTPGLVMLALAYLSKILPQMEEFYKLAVLLFDEFKVTNR